MADADRNPISGLDPVYFPTGAVLERPVTDRPTHDTIDAIIDWLAGPAHHNSLSLAGEFDEFAWRMLAAGLPLLRATLHLRTLHPQYLGANFVWWRTAGRTVLTFVAHEVQDLFAHEDNPVRRVMVAGETIRRRVDVAGDALDFSILHDLKAEGATWSSDLRGFTERSDRLAGIQVIAMLNALFDAQGKAIVGHGGEILKFIGDGLLAIFPIKSADMAAAAASNP